jgi:hypothetical protein
MNSSLFNDFIGRDRRWPVRRTKALETERSSSRERLALSAALFVPLGALVIAFCRTDLTSWDMVGHVRSAVYYRDHLWPSLYGWNETQGFGGYPQGYFYPPLFAWLVGGLGKVFAIEWVFRILLGASVLLLPGSALLFLRSLGCRPRASLGAVFFMLTALLVATPKSFGGFFSSTFRGGLVTAQWSMPFVFFYLFSLKRLVASWRGVPHSAALLALLVMSHGFNGVAAILLSCVYVPFFAKTPKGISLSAPRYIGHGLLALVLAAVWVGPTVVYHSWTSGRALPNFNVWAVTKQGAWFYLPALGLALAACSRALRRGAREYRGLVYPALFLIAIYGVLRWLSSAGVAGGLPLHPYRFLVFAFVFGGLAAGYVWASGRFARITVWMAAGVYAVGVVFCVRQDLSIATRDLGVGAVDVPASRGLVSESSLSELTALSSPHLLASKLEERGATLVNGVFVESSSVSPYISALLRELDPKSYVGNAERVATRRDLARWHESVLGISWVLSDRQLARNSFAPSEQATRLELPLTVDGEQYRLSTYEYRTDYPVAEFFAAPPLVASGDFARTVREWWESGQAPGRTPLRATELPHPYKSVASSGRVDLEALQPDHYQVDIESSEPRWVLLKIPYFPTWHAFQNGVETPVYEASVHMMALFANGRVDLVSRPGRIEKVCGMLSLAGWICLAMTIALLFVRERLCRHARLVRA